MASENLKKFALLLIKTEAQAEKSFADGFQFRDLFDFYPEIIEMPSVSFKDMATEIKTRTEATKQELKEFINQNLNLANDYVENIIEKIVAAIIAIDDVIQAIMNKPVTPPPTL